MERSRSGGEIGSADGRRASIETLRRRLPHGPPDFLVGALDNPVLGPDEVLLIVRNRLAPAGLLARIGATPRWTGRAAIRRSLVQHPSTPLVLARRLVVHLFWNELADVALSPRAHPVVRRDAERLLRARLEDLSLGERVALARKASRGLLAALIESGDARVLSSALGNPRLVEADAVAIARAPRAPAEALSRLGAHPNWGRRRAVRLALLRNPRSPVALSLRLVQALPRRELPQLVRDETVPRIVRVGAQRRLAGGSGRTAADGRRTA